MPWDLWCVQNREDWVNDAIQDELIRKLSPEVHRPRKSDWMPDQHHGHHEVVVQREPLVTDEELLKVHERGQPQITSIEKVP